MEGESGGAGDIGWCISWRTRSVLGPETYFVSCPRGLNQEQRDLGASFKFLQTSPVALDSARLG